MRRGGYGTVDQVETSVFDFNDIGYRKTTHNSDLYLFRTSGDKVFEAPIMCSLSVPTTDTRLHQASAATISMAPRPSLCARERRTPHGAAKHTVTRLYCLTPTQIRKGGQEYLILPGITKEAAGLGRMNGFSKRTKIYTNI